MSLTTTARFYSTDPGLISHSHASKCFSLSGSLLSGGVIRQSSSQSSWKAFKNEVEQDQKSEWIGSSLTKEEVSGLVSDRFLLTVDLGSPPMLGRVYSAVLANIPPAVFGDHCPNAMALNVGWHDIYDDVENEDGHFYARASFSISFWGPQIPNDLNDYRARFFQLPEVLAVKKDLENVLGTLDSCLILNV